MSDGIVPLTATGDTTTIEPDPRPKIVEVVGGAYTWQKSEEALSPSLWKNREEPAFELKFQLDHAKAELIRAWAREHLTPDPHGRPELGHAYLVHGLYFDTPALDVYKRSPRYKRKKFRLRRYGDASTIFLEQKRKSNGKVAKRRVLVAESDLQRLQEVPDPQWDGHWFHNRLTLRGLVPSCLISYRRQAFFGHNSEGPLRLTLDYDLRSQATQQFKVEPVAAGTPMLADSVLLELKYRKNMPALFRSMMQDFGLTPGAVSKYRHAVEVIGRVPIGGGSSDEV